MNSSLHLFNKPLLAPRPVPPGTQKAEVVGLRKGPRRNVSSACIACKTKRKKCDGNQPCSSCARLEAHCQYAPRHDGRRDLKNKLVAFETDSKSLHRILDMMRGANETDAVSLFNSMRRVSSVKELEALIKEGPEIESMKSTIRGESKGNSNNATIPTSVMGSSAPSVTSISFTPSKSNPKKAESCTLAGSSVPNSPFSNTSLETEQSLSSSDRLSTTVHSKQPEMTPAIRGHHSQSPRTSDFVDSRITSQQESRNVPNSTYRYVDRHFFPFHPLSGNHFKHLIHESQSWHPALKYNPEFFTNPPTSYSLADNLNLLGTLRINGCPLTLEEQQLQIFHKAEWSISPLAFDDGSTLCRTTTSFLAAARILIDQGASVDAIIGDDRPQVDCFFSPRRLLSPGDISVSHWACSLFSSFEDLERPFVLIWILLVYRLMRVR